MRAVIMGGTSGIGLATAEKLTKSGIDVTVTGRNEAKVADARGKFAGAEQLDGTDRDAVAAFFARFGPFEHLVADDQLVAEQGVDDPSDAVVGQAAVEGLDQLGGGEVADPVSGGHGGVAERDQDVTFCRFPRARGGRGSPGR
jgi:NAD(P)-dependent dehydrogenase (short-subunit alcohol dehydrogenase family)